MLPNCVIIKNYNTGFRCVAYYKKDIEFEFKSYIKSNNNISYYTITVKDENNNEYVLLDTNNNEDAIRYSTSLSIIIGYPTYIYKLTYNNINDSVIWNNITNSIN